MCRYCLYNTLQTHLYPYNTLNANDRSKNDKCITLKAFRARPFTRSREHTHLVSSNRTITQRENSTKQKTVRPAYALRKGKSEGKKYKSFCVSRDKKGRFSYSNLLCFTANKSTKHFEIYYSFSFEIDHETFNENLMVPLLRKSPRIQHTHFAK